MTLRSITFSCNDYHENNLLQTNKCRRYWVLHPFTNFTRKSLLHSDFAFSLILNSIRSAFFGLETAVISSSESLIEISLKKYNAIIVPEITKIRLFLVTFVLKIKILDPKTRFSVLARTGNDLGRAPCKRMPRYRRIVK